MKIAKIPLIIESNEDPSSRTRSITDHTNNPKILKDNILVESLGKSCSISLNDRASGVTPIYCKDHWFPKNLIEICNEIVRTPCKHFKSPEFSFSMDGKAAEKNWKILEKYNLDFELAMKNQKGTPLEYGSEFRDHLLLEKLFKFHPLWPKLKSLLLEGGKFPLEHLPIEEKKKDAIEGLEYGNHKGADNNLDLLKKMVNEDVTFGFALPIPTNKVLQIEGALLSPLNIQDQFGINEKGEITGKKRLTHNQSMKYQSGTSVNSRVIEEELQDVMYGHCLLRVVHHIVKLRLKHPNKRILIGKIDWKSAYRRGHLHPETAIQTITQIPQSALAFIALRLTFGGNPCPNIWDLVSESTTDLTNALLQCEQWDPKMFQSPLQDRIDEDLEEDCGTPFAEALPLHVSIPDDNKGKADVYIDDITTVTVDINNNVERAAAATLLAIHIIGRPEIKSDPIPRKDLVSLSKLEAEGTMEETKILLGWRLNSRRLSVSLPKEKFLGWSETINKMLHRGQVTPSELESMIGRLNHITIIISHAKHFMSRIRYLFERSKNRRSIKLDDECREDFILHKKFLEHAYKGISMNLITYRKPTHKYRSDACPFGMGGFSLQGRAWRFFIPEELRFRATLNMLEHLSTIIGPWIDIIEGNMERFSCILSESDSTTSCGWLKKSNFKYSDEESKELTKAKLQISRDHARRMMERDCCEYSQHIPGETNDLADALSRDFSIPNDHFTKLAFQFLPTQVPIDFKISPLPQEILSFLFSLLRELPSKTQQLEKHKKGKLGLGLAGMISSKKWNSTTTPSLTLSTNTKQTSSSQPSPNQSEIECTQEKAHPLSAVIQSEPPWTTFLRPSEKTTNTILGKTETESLAAFYNNSTKAIKKRTLQRNNKRPSHFQSSEKSSKRQNVRTNKES